MSTSSTYESASRELFSDHIAAITGRFERALEACKFDRLLIFAGQESLLARDDQAYPFHAEPYFLQCLPVSAAPGSIIEFVPGHKLRLVFLQPTDFWHMPPPVPEAFWTGLVEIVVVESAAQARSALGNGQGRTAGIGDAGGTDFGCEALNDPHLLHWLDYHRAYKTRYEIERQMQATATAVRGHRAVAEAFAGGQISEFLLHQRYCRATMQREGDLPYPSIIGLNEHASTLHYQACDRRPPSDMRSLLIDAGASCDGYASDITRTYGTGRHGFDELIASIEDLQQSLCAQVRAGVEFVDLNERAHELLAEAMRENDLLNCSADEAYASGLTRTFLPHGLGHLLGLQVHDAGGRQVAPDGEERPPPVDHPFLRLTRRLEPGFVLTIEPGLYLIPSLLNALSAAQRAQLNWTTIERLLPYGGIRIEDNLLVEWDGQKNLTRIAFANVTSNT